MWFAFPNPNIPMAQKSKFDLIVRAELRGVGTGGVLDFITKLYWSEDDELDVDDIDVSFSISQIGT